MYDRDKECPLIPEDAPTLIRIHPKAGGADRNFGGHRWRGVVWDKYVFLNKADRAAFYEEVLKFNVNISMNTTEGTACRDFFYQVTTAVEIDDTGKKIAINPFGTALKKTRKCEIHGDKETGLYPSAWLIDKLSRSDLKSAKKGPPCFSLGDDVYVFYSVGVAANWDLRPVDRDDPGTKFASRTSHLEIKFTKKLAPGTKEHPQLVCLNVHLQSAYKHEKSPKDFTVKAALGRLATAIEFFYVELNALKFTRASDENWWREKVKKIIALRTLPLDVFNRKGIAPDYMVVHPKSIAALITYLDAKEAKALGEKPVSLAASGGGSGRGGAAGGAGAPPAESLVFKKDSSDDEGSDVEDGKCFATY